MGLNIVWLGDLGFPYGMAASQRIRLIFKGLMQHGDCGTVINTYGIYDNDAGLNIDVEGVYEKIKYIHASGSPYRSKNIFVRNIRKIWGLINEVYIIYTLHKNKELDAAILGAHKFKSLVFYRALSLLIGFPIIMNCVEMFSSIRTIRGVRQRRGSYLYEKYAFYLLDGIMPISDYLVNLVKSRNPRLPVMKVPMITDFERFNGIKKNTKEKYFLFCGAAGYSKIINFILLAYESLEMSEVVRLYLVVHGTPGEMSRLKAQIADNKKNSLIKVYSRITDYQLTELYANACGLLIPLRQHITDRARFPHKIGEYLASGNPIVTTNYGEVNKFFKDEKSALIAGSYDIAEFADKMKYIISHPEKAEEIGKTGREVGLKNFNYKQYGARISEFIGNIIKSN